MMKLTFDLKNDVVRTLVIATVALMLVGGGLWWWTRAERNRLQTRIAHARRQLAHNSVKDVKRRMTRLKEEVAALRKRSASARISMPQNDHLAQVLHGLSESMNARGVQVSETLVHDPEAYINYTAIPISIEFKGSFPAAFGVLREIGKMPRLIRAESLRIKRQPRKPDEGVTVHLDVSTFYCPDGAASDSSKGAIS